MLMPSIFRDNFVDDFINDMFSMPPALKNTIKPSNLMNTDVKEFEDKYQLAIELPGFDKKNITVDLKDGYLTITGVQKEEVNEEDEKARYIRKERFNGTCQRQFYVGDRLTEEDIKAAYSDGVLKITIPKKEEKPEIEEKKYIAIE